MYTIYTYLSLIAENYTGPIGSHMQTFWTEKLQCFFIHHPKHVFCVLNRTHWDNSYEYPWHMFLLRNKKIIF